MFRKLGASVQSSSDFKSVKVKTWDLVTAKRAGVKGFEIKLKILFRIIGVIK